MKTLEQIERLAEEYAEHRRELAAHLDRLQLELDEVKRRHLPRLRDLAADAAIAGGDLKAAVEESPELFTRPRTRVLHGIKVGFTKGKGKVVWDDEARVIERIRKLLPESQAELLIRVRESVHKPGLYDLTTADLKRLGVRIEDTGDAVVCKPVDSEIDKLVAQLVAECMEDAA